MRLRTVPVTFAQAREFISDWHRHHRPPVGHKYSLGVADDRDVLVGVAVVGRPVARHLDDGLTLSGSPPTAHPTRAACSMPRRGRQPRRWATAGWSPTRRKFSGSPFLKRRWPRTGAPVPPDKPTTRLGS